MRFFPLILAVLFVSCGTDGRVRRAPAEVRHYGLSERTRIDLAADPEVEEELNRVLIKYFGEPDAPHLASQSAWIEEGFDPNASPFQGGRPDLLKQGVSVDSLREDNALVWRQELELLAANDSEQVGPFRGRRKMSLNWRELLQIDPEPGPNAASDFFLERYPPLAEAGELFGVLCARCHGFEGGGNGPMGARLFPKPRNYRGGTFKYVGTLDSVKPRRTDLLRTLIHGLPGTAMPSFRRLGSSELNALADYVRLLSIRGEVESMLVDEWIDGDVPPEQAIDELYELIWERWLSAEQEGLVIHAPTADPDPTRWHMGRKVFLDPASGNCFSCHGTQGTGDGPSALRVDEEGQTFALLKDDWNEFVLPRDLSKGVFRGGSRREDIYMRMYCGIPGTPMPSLGQSYHADGTPLLGEEAAWALVDYVLSLSGQGPLAGVAGASGTLPAPTK